MPIIMGENTNKIKSNLSQDVPVIQILWDGFITSESKSCEVSN